MEQDVAYVNVLEAAREVKNFPSNLKVLCPFKVPPQGYSASSKMSSVCYFFTPNYNQHVIVDPPYHTAMKIWREELN